MLKLILQYWFKFIWKYFAKCYSRWRLFGVKFDKSSKLTDRHALIALYIRMENWKYLNFGLPGSHLVVNDIKTLTSRACGATIQLVIYLRCWKVKTSFRFFSLSLWFFSYELIRKSDVGVKCNSVNSSFLWGSESHLKSLMRSEFFILS